MVMLPINSTSGNQSSSRFESKVRIASSPDVSCYMMMMMMMMMMVVVMIIMIMIMMMMIMMIPATMFSALSMLMTRRPAGLGLLINASLSSSKWYMGTVVDYGNGIVNDYGNSDSDSDSIPSNLLGATSRLPRMSLMILLTRLSTLKSRIPY